MDASVDFPSLPLPDHLEISDLSPEKQRLTTAALQVETSKGHELNRLQQQKQSFVAAKAELLELQALFSSNVGPGGSQPPKQQPDFGPHLETVEQCLWQNTQYTQMLQNVHIPGYSTLPAITQDQVSGWPSQQPATLSAFPYTVSNSRTPEVTPPLYNPSTENYDFGLGMEEQTIVTDKPENVSTSVTDYRTDFASDAASKLRGNPTQISAVGPRVEDLGSKDTEPIPLRVDQLNKRADLRSQKAVRLLTQQLLGIQRDKDASVTIAAGQFVTREETERYALGDDQVAPPSLEPFRPCWDVLDGDWNRQLETCFVQRFKRRYPQFAKHELHIRLKFQRRLIALKKNVSYLNPHDISRKGAKVGNGL
ncbi:hypothetical protein B0H16DRAFT_1478311 [Mycena metata]|uniref:Uncharacterized protein n=1 Tax=Mycena metata TaxID=1033252 RepID=A0AAD7H6W1_9AGAR|nr:hypothetical protein B0H16DRAFT_1478311 [Mycena metata]